MKKFDRSTVKAALTSTRTRAGLALGVGATVAIAGTMATWSDTAEVNGINIGTGSMDIKVSATATGTFTDSLTGYTGLDTTTLSPGTSATGLISVKNTGSAAANITMDATATNSTLNAALSVRVTDGAITNGKCSGTAVGPTKTGFSAGLITAQPVAIGAVKTFCVEATLDANAASTLQNVNTGASLTFNAAS